MKSALLFSIVSAVTFLSASAFADSSVLCRVSKYETDQQLFLGRIWQTNYLVISANDEVELQSIGAMKSDYEGAVIVAASFEDEKIKMYLSTLKLVNGYPRTDTGTEFSASRKGSVSMNLTPRGIKISCKETY